MIFQGEEAKVLIDLWSSFQGCFGIQSWSSFQCRAEATQPQNRLGPNSIRRHSIGLGRIKNKFLSHALLQGKLPRRSSRCQAIWWPIYSASSRNLFQRTASKSCAAVAELPKDAGKPAGSRQTGSSELQCFISGYLFNSLQIPKACCRKQHSAIAGGETNPKGDIISLIKEI